jgi:hypothetical protein
MWWVISEIVMRAFGWRGDAVDDFSEIVMRAFGWRGDVVDDFSESVSGQGARC